jgi:hypothetical protein
MNLNFVGLVTTLPNQDDDWPQKGLPKGFKGALKGFSWSTQCTLHGGACRGLKQAKKNRPKAA